jgi:hypothetical protein
MGRLNKLGITTRARLIGISDRAAARWAEYAGSSWTAYAAIRTNATANPRQNHEVYVQHAGAHAKRPMSARFDRCWDLVERLDEVAGGDVPVAEDFSAETAAMDQSPEHALGGQVLQM